MTELEAFYLRYDEPLGSTFVALRTIILSADDKITPTWKYKLPFFCYNNKNICYLWKDKKTNLPYIGFMDGNKLAYPLLESGERSRVKVFSVNPHEDLPVADILEILQEAINLHKK